MNEKVFTKWDYLVFGLLSTLGLSTILYFGWYWMSLQGWQHFPVTFTIGSLILGAPLLNHQLRWFLLIYMRRPKPMAARAGWKVAVVTTFVPGAEPFDMLEETLTALLHLEYPHDTWVLDEGEDERVKALCLRLGASHFSRRRFTQYQTKSGLFQSRSKHGNYNAWLYEVGFGRYDIITSFDPDHIPVRSFLLEVLGYFQDPKVSYVQCAQVYYNQKASFIAQGAAEETYAYYSSTQMASYGLEYPIITGCHTTHRKTALKQIGGFAPHDADDLLMTLFYRAAGWRGVYVPKILAQGLTPVDWSGYINQQRRWARSVLDIKFRIFPELSEKLPLKTRVISFLHGLNYIQDSLITLLSLILMAFMLATGISPIALSHLNVGRLALLFAVLWFCDLYRQRFYLGGRKEWGIQWRARLLEFAEWPYILWSLCEVILGRRFPYSLTLKVKGKSRPPSFFWPHVLVAGLICMAWIIGMIQYAVHPLLHFAVIWVIAESLVLLSTERMHFPEPYDRNLREKVNCLTTNGSRVSPSQGPAAKPEA